MTGTFVAVLVFCQMYAVPYSCETTVEGTPQRTLSYCLIEAEYMAEKLHPTRVEQQRCERRYP